jgi:hypothetical protein
MDEKILSYVQYLVHILRSKKIKKGHVKQTSLGLADFGLLVKTARKQVSQTTHLESGRFVHCLLFSTDAKPSYVLFQYDPVWLSADQVASHHVNGQTYYL